MQVVGKAATKTNKVLDSILLGFKQGKLKLSPFIA
jgi:hypothetical protein